MQQSKRKKMKCSSRGGPVSAAFLQVLANTETSGKQVKVIAKYGHYFPDSRIQRP
jgi:hypothetical protein